MALNRICGLWGLAPVRRLTLTVIIAFIVLVLIAGSYDEEAGAADICRWLPVPVDGYRAKTDRGNCLLFK